MKRTLIYFDDQVQNLEAFKELLSDKFDVICSADVTMFSSLLMAYNPHAFLLDVHMPVMDGHALYQKIIEHPSYNGCPIIFISDDQSDQNKLTCYEKGAVDFLPRNIRPEEISIRLMNMIKFHSQVSTKFELGNLTLDVEEMKATIDGKNADLTLLEFRMLNNILRVYPETLTRTELIERIWGDKAVKPGTINTHFTNLKPKIETWDHQIRVRDENILVQKK
jgi:DNA-binding response OmpR family regulator